MTVQKSHGNQNPVNLALLNCVQEHGQASYADLFKQFGDASDSTVKAHARFCKKMEYLCFTQQLSSTGRGHSRLFSLGPEAGKPGRSRGYADRSQPRTKNVPAAVDNDPATIDPCSPLGIALRHAADRDALRDQPAPSPSYNSMQAPVYVAPPGAALRPGALDYQRHASRGVRC